MSYLRKVLKSLIIIDRSVGAEFKNNQHHVGNILKKKKLLCFCNFGIQSFENISFIDFK